MNKLVKLLNEFEKEKTISEGGWVDEDAEYFGRSLEDGRIVNWSYDRDAHRFMKYYIISKDFKFIERLVKNDKIDKDTKFLISVNVENQKNGRGYTKAFESYECLLMLLAMRDDTLKSLSAILK